MEYNSERFQGWVQEAWDCFPPEIRRRISDVSVLILETPTPEQLLDLGIAADEELPFGIYAGQSILEEATEAPTIEPPRIALFPETFYECCNEEWEIKEEIRVTLWHEVAHRLGFEEDNMPERLL